MEDKDSDVSTIKVTMATSDDGSDLDSPLKPKAHKDQYKVDFINP